MKKKNAFFGAVLSIALALTVSGCSLSGLQGQTGTDTAAGTTVAESPASSVSTDSNDYAGTVTFSSTGAETGGLASAEDSTAVIRSAGTYLITGSSDSGQIIVDTDKDSSVTLVLNDLDLTSAGGPAVWAKSGQLTIVLVGSNSLTDSATYTLEEGSDEPDACIYSKDDLTVTGSGSLEVTANYRIGIESKDDLTIENGTVTVISADDAIRGHDSVTIQNGTLDLDAGADAIKSNNDSDADKGTVTILGGNIAVNCSDDGIDAVNDITITGGVLTISSGDDAVHTDTSVSVSGGSFSIVSGDDAVHAEYELTVTGGEFDITAHEAFEACIITIDDGNFTINASDDAINATSSWGSAVPCIEINGGRFDITVAQGDTDALDSNGNLYINGGTLNISAQSPFDYDGEGKLNGGTVYVNGTQVTQLTSQMMGGFGGFGGMSGPAEGEPPESQQSTIPGQGGFPGGRH